MCCPKVRDNATIQGKITELLLSLRCLVVQLLRDIRIHERERERERARVIDTGTFGGYTTAPSKSSSWFTGGVIHINVYLVLFFLMFF